MGAGLAAGWLDERVRPLVRYPTGDGATWVPLERVTDASVLETIERNQLAGAGAPQKVALTTAAGWMAGYVTALIAVGLLRDGVLLRLSEATGAEVLREGGGWLCDLRLDDAPLVVPPGHALAGQPGVTVADDPAAEFGAEVQRSVGPWVDALAVRSRRSRSGLWAMAADAVGTATSTIAAAEPGRSPEDWLAASAELLGRDGTPWKRGPTQWVVDVDGAPRVVQHRSSCCLWYRCDPDDADDPAAARAEITEEPNYCSTCVFRDAADVEARVRAG